MKPQSVLIGLFFVLQLLFYPSLLSAQQSNFSISPPPIPYPYFDEGRSDIAVNGSYVGITASQMTMKGAFFDLKARQALAQFLAFDLCTGLGAMTGSMPGIPPMTPIYTSGAYHIPYYTKTTENSSLAFMNMLFSAGIEVQPIRSDTVDMILFGGFTMNYSQLTITTPYELIVPPPYSNAGTVYKGYRNTLSISAMPYGYQAGIQFDITLAEDLRISPFFMMSTTSGTATMVENPGVSSASSTSSSVNIPSSTSYSYGLDILIGDLSIGTVLQQMQSANQQNGDARVIMISAGYHFSTGTEQEKDSGTE